MGERIRVQKAMSAAGLMSRRAGEQAIESGRVSINGVVARLGDRVEMGKDRLTLDGVPVQVDPAVETHLLNKPRGVVSTASDPQGRTTVVDLVPSERRLYPVGRLDYDSEGLILVTNDGELTNIVTHPRHGITKTYLAMVRDVPDAASIRRLASGVRLEDGPAAAHSARMVDAHGGRALVEVVMGEGRNREVRRMFDAIGHEVTRLTRTAIGPLTGGDLAPGGSRLLSAAEIRALLASARDG